MNIAVMGAGSIGLHLAGQLWMGGHKVTVICRQSEQASYLNENGLTYINFEGHTHQIPVEAISLLDGPESWDWIFLTVKQTQIPSAISYLKNITGTLRILCFQNGIGHQERIKEELPHAKIYAAITTEGAYRLSPAAVRHTGRGLTAFGTWEEGEGEQDLHEINMIFAKMTMRAQIDEVIRERIWKKLIINSCINPLTALLEVTNGKLLDLPSAKHVMEKLFLEAQEVARLEGIKIDSSFLQEIVNVCRNTYVNKSSMLQDIEAGRETEIEYINSAIVRMGRQHGFQAVQHSLIKDLIIAKQTK